MPSDCPHLNIGAQLSDSPADAEGSPWRHVQHLPDVGLRESPPETSIDIAGATYIELPESGWGALVGYVAGVKRMLRCQDKWIHFTTSVSYYRDGTVRRDTRPSGSDERAEVFDDIDDYLAEVGIVPRPRGFRWFLRLPTNVATADQFWEKVNGEWTRVGRDGAPTAEWKTLLGSIIEPLYPPPRKLD